jgi:hypothetical protein
MMPGFPPLPLDSRSVESDRMRVTTAMGPLLLLLPPLLPLLVERSRGDNAWSAEEAAPPCSIWRAAGSGESRRRGNGP